MVTTEPEKVEKHNHGPNFGRKVDGCPRCKQLENGAPAVPGWRTYKSQDAERAAEIRAHFASVEHKYRCGRVCTFGDW